MLQQPSNPVTGLSLRPEQACLGAPQWKYQLGDFGEFRPQSVCGRCQGTSQYMITSTDSPLSLPTNLPPLSDWMLVKGNLKSKTAQEELAEADPDYQLQAEVSALLEYTRCHWKSSKVPSYKYPPFNEGAGDILWYLFYGLGINPGGEGGGDDLSQLGVFISFSGNRISWIDEDHSSNCIPFPFQQAESQVFCLGGWKADFATPPDNMITQYKGWTLGFMLREFLFDPFPSLGGVCLYYPILMYQLESKMPFYPLFPNPLGGITGVPYRPFKCCGTNRWSCVYNPLSYPEHVLVTKPFNS